ncbi:class I SAM-dependent methyltransferase [bacterium]|nr:class I SAM-dependent methyltransferase [bacterium]
MTDLCDYAGYDYKKEFWEDSNRRYEDLTEQLTLRKLIRGLGISGARILDLGCGFGRLFGAYRPFGREFVLLDYSENMLSQARQSLGGISGVTFVQGNALSLPFDNAQFDLIVSVRTLHHLAEYQTFIQQIERVLVPGGVAIFEIPNFRHWLNIFRFLVGKQSNPFVRRTTSLGQRFVNYHPALIYNAVSEVGLVRIQKVNTSFFRSEFIKRRISAKVLAALDLALQPLLSWMDLTPSIYCVVRKPK